MELGIDLFEQRNIDNTHMLTCLTCRIHLSFLYQFSATNFQQHHHILIFSKLEPDNQTNPQSTIDMGCASSRPSRPVPQPRKQTVKQTIKPQKHNAGRLSRPFDPDIPLHVARPQRTSQLSDKERYGDAYAQLNARSKQPQTSRKDKKAQYAHGHRVKSQAAHHHRFKGDTLYFTS